MNKAINVNRVLLITMMILVHITLWGNTYPEAKAAILSFMMPAFLFITGYLFRVERDWKDFILYQWQLFVPYTILVCAFAVLSYFLPTRESISELTFSAVAEKIFITSIGPYWFLRTMFYCGGFWYLVWKLLGKRCSKASLLIIYAMALLLFTIVLPSQMSISAALYYFIGVVVRYSGLSFQDVVRPSLFALPLLLLIVTRPEWQDWAGFGIVVAAYCALSTGSWLCEKIPNGRMMKWINFIGMNTLPIYLLHPIFTMAAKFYAPLFEWDNTTISFTLFTLLLSLGGSLGLAYVTDKTKISLVLGRKKLLRPIQL